MCESVDWSIEVASASSPTVAPPFSDSTAITRTLSTLSPSLRKSACQPFIMLARRVTRKGTVLWVTTAIRALYGMPYTRPVRALVFLSLFVAFASAAQDYPARPLHLVLPQPPGGAVDFISRTLGATLQKSMGQPIVVDNKPGANGIVAAEFVARSPADGYTLFMAVDTNLVVNPNLYAKVPYDPFHDFVPISVIARNALVLVA